MNVNRQQERTADEAALSWAMSHFEFQKKIEISCKPWGSTFRLSNSAADAYLKILPVPLKSAARTTPRLGEKFRGHVPRAIASDEELGFLLLEDHGGKDLPRSPSNTERLSMVRTYAEIQAKAALDGEWLSQHPRFDLDNVVQKFVEFLRPGSQLSGIVHGRVSAEYFLGLEDARGYYELFSDRTDLLTKHVASAKGLRDTINHLDLRSSNAAMHDGGACILYDWDESLVGPAGLSLHNVFKAGLTPVALLAKARDYINPDEDRFAVRLLSQYLESLTKAEYATEDELRACLGGSISAGLMHYVTGFALYPQDNEGYQSTIASNIRNSLSELLNICDFLTIEWQDPRVFKFVRKYSSTKRGHRAEGLLDSYLHRHPSDPVALEELGRHYLNEGTFPTAIVAFGNALRIAPENASLHTEIAAAHLASGDFDSALYHLNRSSLLTPANERTQQLLEQATSLHQSRERASWPGTVPMVDFTDGERMSQSASSGKLELCVETFQKYGVLQMNNVFDQHLLRNCHTAFLEKYDRFLQDDRHKDALRIGNKRLQVTIDLTPPFDDDSLFANGLLLPLFSRLLSEWFILGAYTSSMSLPGADDQDLHKDHKSLYPERRDIKNLPSFAISVMIPLIDVDERVGTTRVRKGTHQLTNRESKDYPTQSPLVDLGSCYLMDYRLSHYGQANQSDVPRPILNILYQRAWFKDFMNFKHQPSIRVSKERFKSLPEPQRALLEWTQNPSPTQPE